MSKIRIISHSEEQFNDRVEAGRYLSRELKIYGGADTVVLGIPRGGIVVAREISLALGCRLDIVLSRKVGAPGNPELAIGAISEGGKLFLNESIVPEGAENSAYVKEETSRQLAEIARRVKLYRQALPKVPLKDKTVIVTDDGLATGATMQASLWAARQEGPKKLISAVPVGPEDTVARLSDDADEVICLRVPAFFAAVGQFYRRFDQTSDEEVLEILRQECKEKSGK